MEPWIDVLNRHAAGLGLSVTEYDHRKGPYYTVANKSGRIIAISTRADSLQEWLKGRQATFGGRRG